MPPLEVMQPEDVVEYYVRTLCFFPDTGRWQPQCPSHRDLELPYVDSAVAAWDVMAEHVESEDAFFQVFIESVRNLLPEDKEPLSLLRLAEALGQLRGSLMTWDELRATVRLKALELDEGKEG